LSGDMVAHEVVEAATHKLWGDWTAALGCRYPCPASLAMTHDSQETICVDIGPTTRPPNHVRHQRPPPRAKPQGHRNPRYLLRAKATLRGHSRGLWRRWGTGPAPLTPPLTLLLPLQAAGGHHPRQQQSTSQSQPRPKAKAWPEELCEQRPSTMGARQQEQTRRLSYPRRGQCPPNA
jgi:hypothetical protein